MSRLSRSRKKPEESEDATVKTAEAVAEPVISRPLTPGEKKLGGPVVHYAFGALVGSVYGALAASLPVITIGFGTAYGSAVWLLGDEAAVPALGLAPPPAEQPVASHFKFWLMHAVYGATLEGSRRLLTNAR